MAVKARATVTLASIRDVASVTRYYILQSSTAAAPSKPTASPPGGSWTKTEPSYSTGSTKSLYFTDLTVFTDGSYSYSDVCLSSSYEAAKAAYNKSVIAQQIAESAQEDIDGLEVGGRNYLLVNPKLYTPAAYNAYGLVVTEPLIAGQTYTIQLWDADVSNSGKTVEELGIYVYYCGGIVTFGKWKGTSYFTEGHADHLVLSFTPTEANINHSDVTGAVIKYIRLYNSPPIAAGDKYMAVGKWKLEKGNRGTDWELAPEDVEEKISDAQSTADTALAQSVEYIVGTQTATTASWTGKTTDAVLKAGKTIAYRLPQTSAANATLNLTLSGGGTTGEKAVYYNNSRVGTHYPAYSVIHMTYDGSSWRITNYNADTQNRVRLQNNIVAAGAISTSHIICGTESGYKDIAAGVSFDLSYPLLFAGTAIAAGATTGTRDNNFLRVNSVAATNNGTITSGETGKTLYLKGTVSGNTFTIAGSPFMTTVVPSTEDGFIYLPLGLMYSASNIYFSSSDKLYAYKDGSFRELARGEAAAASRTATDYLYETGSGDLIEAPDAPSSDAEAAAMSGFYTKIKSSGAGAGFDVYQGDGTSSGQKRVAHYGAEAVIGADDEAHTTIGQGRMVFDDDAQNLMFMGRTNNDTTGKALCQLSLPLDHKTVVGSTWEFTEAWDLSFPEKTVSEIIGVGFVAEGLEELTSAQWSATIEGGLLTKITITELGVNRITEYLENYAEVNSLVVKFLTADSVQTYVLDNANNDYITPVSPTLQTDVPGDGAFSVGGGLASSDDSVAMAGGVASGRRSFAFGYSSETGPARSSKEGEVRFKSEKMAVEGEFMTFGSEGEISGVSFNSTYVNTSSSYINVYELGDYVRLDGAIVTKANVPAGSVLASNLPKSFFGGGDQGKPRMRIFGKLVLPASQTGVITGTHGTLQAILIANQWVDAGSVTIPSAGVWLVRFNFNMTDSVATGHITGQINYGESGTTGVRNRQSVYFNKSTKDLCLTVVALITTTGSASVPCRLYSTFASSSPGNAYVNVSAVRLSGGDLSDVAELNIMNDEDLEEMTTTPTYKASLLTRGATAVPSGSTICFGATYIRDSLWDGGYNG